MVIFFYGCNEDKKSNISKYEKEKYEKEKFLFGTYLKITVYEKDKNLAKNAIDLAYNEIERIDKKFNSKVEGSLIFKINNMQNSEKEYKEIDLDEEGQLLFEKIKNGYELSSGEYDITMGPLMKLWGFGDDISKNHQIPSFYDIEKTKEKIDFTKIEFSNGKLIMKYPVEEIDTGSFLKGYAVSKAKEKMVHAGITSAFITSTSSIAAIGRKPDNTPWRIGIQDPNEPSEIIGVIEMDNNAMGASGDYQTFIEIDDKKYHHILQKSTGFPVNDKKLVLVLFNDAFLADIYSTCFFLMPIDKVMDFVYTIDCLDILIMKSNGEILKSKNIEILD
jgi:thiamine biosynthesis lipoprotein